MMRAGDFFAVQETILRRWSPQGRFAPLVYGFVRPSRAADSPSFLYCVLLPEPLRSGSFFAL